VLQGLCCIDAQGDKVRDLLDEFFESSRDDAETIKTARKLLDEILADQEACDEILIRHARHWQLGRLAMVDRNILRLGVFELRMLTSTPGSIITESLKLAQEFSSADSPRFVNGILDAVAKEISGDIGEEEG
jgi:transcription antitermination factor NusB